MDTNAKIKKIVQQSYGTIALTKTSCCPGNSCCSPNYIAKNIGYLSHDIDAIGDANLGLGCGNPTAIASLKEGDVVCDLGSGAGIDCFLAAKKVGDKGRVIGIDMTPEMIQLAQHNAKKLNIHNVEFLLGDIEHIPVDDNSVDVVISNCVINLAPDKAQVFKEVYRILKKGGRMAISDIVLDGELPAAIKESVEAYVGCVAGALQKTDYLDLIKKAGFSWIDISKELNYGSIYDDNNVVVNDLDIDMKQYKDVIKSISLIAVK